MFFIAIVLSTLAAAICTTELYRQSGLTEKKLYFSPVWLFTVKYASFVLFPSIVIFYSPRWESVFFVLRRFGNAQSLIGASVFYIVFWCAFQTTSRTKKVTETIATPARTYCLWMSVLFFVAAILLWCLQYLLTGQSVTILAVKGLMSLDVSIIFDGYNDARYGITKKAFLEGGQFGMGSLSMLSSSLTIAGLALMGLASVSKRVTSFFWGIGATLSFAVAVNSGARNELLDWLVRLLSVRSFFRALPLLATGIVVILAVVGLIGFTALTPKRSMVSSNYTRSLNRLAGNAFNDAVVLDRMSVRDRDGGPFGPEKPVDFYISEHLYGRGEVTWYETPTIVGSTYYSFGWLGIFATSALAGLVIGRLDSLVAKGRRADIGIVNRFMFATYCWTVPLSAVIIPKIFVAWCVIVGILYVVRPRAYSELKNVAC